MPAFRRRRLRGLRRPASPHRPESPPSPVRWPPRRPHTAWRTKRGSPTSASIVAAATRTRRSTAASPMSAKQIVRRVQRLVQPQRQMQVSRHHSSWARTGSRTPAVALPAGAPPPHTPGSTGAAVCSARRRGRSAARLLCRWPRSVSSSKLRSPPGCPPARRQSVSPSVCQHALILHAPAHTFQAALGRRAIRLGHPAQQTRRTHEAAQQFAAVAGQLALPVAGRSLNIHRKSGIRARSASRSSPCRCS